MTNSPPTLDYASVEIALRAPRVAVVVDVDSDHWMFSARIALTQCAATWGGSGFVLVPHRRGEIDPLVLRAVRAYDPDYIATSARTIAQREFAAPGSVGQLISVEGAPSGQGWTPEMLERHGRSVVHDEHSEAARGVVIAATSPHRMALDPDDDMGEWDTDFVTLGDHPSGPGVTAVDSLPTYIEAPCLSAPSDWGGAVGLLTAAVAGSLEMPTAEATTTSADTRFSLAMWLQNLAPAAPQGAGALQHNPGNVTVSAQTDSLPRAWSNSTAGLVGVSSGIGRRSPAFLIVGDTPEDFSLWMILDRVYGAALWLHPDWSRGDQQQQMLEKFQDRWKFERRGIRVASASRDTAACDALVTDLQAINSAAKRNGGTRPDNIAAGPLEWPAFAMRSLAARENFSVELPMPVTRDPDGGVTLAAKPPALSMTTPGDATAESLSWQVDLSIEGSSMPRGRGLGGHHLCAPGQDTMHTWVRSGRSGITWHSKRYDLVVPGIAPDQRVARPKVRELGLTDWIAAMASQRGYEVQYSAAGLRARVLEGLWGDRAAMLNDFASPWRDVFARFGPPGAPGNRGSSHKFNPAEGAVIAGHGAVMTIAGMAQAWPEGTDPSEVRAQVDRLVSRRILRRGLALIAQSAAKPHSSPWTM